MLFEVTLPSVGAPEPVTMHIEAKTWRHAFATAAAGQNLGTDLRGAHVMPSSDGFRVTMPRSMATIYIRRHQGTHATGASVIKAPTGMNPAIVLSTGSQPAAGQVGFRNRHTGAFQRFGAADVPGAARPNPAHDSMHRPDVGAAPSHGAPMPSGAQPAPVPQRPVSAQQPQARLPADGAPTSLEDIFLESGRLFEIEAIEDALDFTIDLAFRSIPCEHAVLLIASDEADHMYPAVARGPLERAISTKERYSIDAGIHASCLRHGIPIALAFPGTDPRYNDDFSSIGLHEQNIACAPVHDNERVFGVLIMFNRDGASQFSQTDLNAIAYIGKELGQFIEQRLAAEPI